MLVGPMSQPQKSQLDFWMNMAIAIINNTLDDNINTIPLLEGPRRRSMACKTTSKHKMERIHLYASKWLGTKWILRKTDQYPHLMHCMCAFKCRTFCACDWIITMCNDCHKIHLMEV